MRADREATSAKLLRVRAADGGARLCLVVEMTDGEDTWREALTVFAARLDRVPTLGELDIETLALLRREDALATALAMGLRSLGAGGSSEQHLARKLRAKGVAGEVAREAVEELSSRGYLDETDAAVREAERGLAKLWGDRRILAELRAKGYGDEALQAARERLRDEDGAARCCRLLQKKHVDVTDDPTATQKLIAALMRYGYTATEIRAALSAECEE